VKSTGVAVLLIVLGVAATLGGLYGQIFLGDDEGHHDGRSPSFALDSAVGADELVVSAPMDNAVEMIVERAGQPIQRDEIHDGLGSYFVTDRDRTYFVRVEGRDASVVLTDVPAGETRVVAQVAPSGGPNLLELGATVAVTGGAVDEQNIADDDEWTEGGLRVVRQGLDFVISETWNGEDVFGGPALLTLLRADDFSFTHAHAELVGDSLFSFATDLPGSGDYLAALEFEQDGERVTARFRFTL